MPINLIIRNPLDRDAREFIGRAGVSDAAARLQLNEFVRGVKQLGLWDSMVCWPLRSTQNAGTGTTAYSLGGLGTFNGTLVNGPTWGADGVAFVNASSQHILLSAQVLNNTDYTAFVAFRLTNIAAANLIAYALSWNRGAFIGVESNGSTRDRSGVWTNTGSFSGAQLSASGVSTVMHTSAATANASEFRLFTNGTSYASGMGNYQLTTGSGHTVIGAASTINSSNLISHFNGDIAFA